MKKKVVSILLAFLTVMCVFAAVSCENPGEPSESDSKGSESVSGEGNTVLESDISILPKIDYEGYTFVMTYRDLQNMVRDMSFDKEATDQLEVAKYNRAERVMDYYNIVLEPYVISGDWAGMMALDSVAAGDSDYDIIMPHSHIAWGTYIIEGYALEWTENMKYNYLDQEWWDQGAAECLSIGNKIYTMMGDNSWMLLGDTVGIVFNKKILSDNSIEYPYQDVLDKTWTFDKFYQIASQTKYDLDGDGRIDFGTDRMGYETTIYGGTVGFLWTCGSRTIGKDSEDMPYIALNNERTVDLFTKFFDMMNQDGFKIMTDQANFDKSCADFIEDKVVMIDTYIMNLELLRDKSDWGVVPYPMFDEQVGEYNSTADAGIHSIIVPYNAPNVDRTSMILEALTIEGHNEVIPAFYETTLQIKYTDDDISKQMLDIIRGSRVFDLAYFTGRCGNFNLPGFHLCNAGGDFSSFYQANLEAAQESLDELVSSVLTKNE